jgi:hypothetical protein
MVAIVVIGIAVGSLDFIIAGIVFVALIGVLSSFGYRWFLRKTTVERKRSA